MRTRLLSAATIAAAVYCATGTSTLATEGGASLYLPGIHGPLAGVLPPPGFYFESDFYSYSGRLSGSRPIQIGGAVVANVQVEARAAFLTPTWVTPIQILGGNLAFAVALPLGIPRVSAGAVITGPRGRTIGFSQRDATFNLGDPVVSAIVGWHAGKFHWTTIASVSVPAGAYQEGELSNLAFNRWIGDLSGSLTYLDPEIGLDISTTVGFEVNGKNDATDYRSGNALHADLAITKNLTKELSIGLIASHYQQVTGDGGSGAALGPYKGRVTAVGGSIGYNFEIAGTPVSTRLKVMREVDVENRSRGTIGLMSIAIPIGHVPATRPASVQPTAAKR